MVIVLVLGVIGFFAFFNSENEYGFVCPSNFTDGEEYLNSVGKWISEYQKDHPDADIDEIISVRDKFIKKYSCGSAPFEVAEDAEDQIDAEELMAGIKYAESQREDSAADSLIKTTNEEELYNNPYIKHLRVAFDGYLDGTNNGIEEGTTEQSELESGYRCGLDSFDKAYFRSKFDIIKTEKNDHGGIIAYITFLGNPGRVFWAWVYPYAGGDYTLRGFCEYAALIPQE